MKQNDYVMVTTKHRGVFFGRLADASQEGSVRLTEAQNCVYWSADCHGFLGLASRGPTEGCRIGPAVPELLISDVTAVVGCTEDAIKAWKAEPWS
jgi:hypothetical protein